MEQKYKDRSVRRKRVGASRDVFWRLDLYRCTRPAVDLWLQHNNLRSVLPPCDMKHGAKSEMRIVATPTSLHCVDPPDKVTYAYPYAEPWVPADVGLQALQDPRWSFIYRRPNSARVTV